MIKGFLAGAILPSLALVFVLLNSDFVDKLRRHFFNESTEISLANKTVFFGDSITRGLNVDEVTDGAINLASEGWTLLQVISQLDRLTARGAELEDAKQIIVMIGINDAYWRDADQMIADYRRMVALIPDTVPVLLGAVLPVNELQSASAFGGNWIGANAKAQMLNAEIESLASAHGWGFMMVDITDDQRMDDGLHLNDGGYEILSMGLRTQLARMPDSGDN